MTGNTKALLEYFNPNTYDIKDIKYNKDIKLDEYNTIIIGTSTWGRGLPPKPFFEIRDSLDQLKDKNIAIYGSGRQEFVYFCGAVDLLNEMLSKKNNVLFTFKYEGYPQEKSKIQFKQLLEEYKL